ncbi:hypothetical protein BDB01DRAFT_853483 [Pilobolus umbonatus]|nr:hypothetical protein BDB01DRAFT_853483 [Pilobolus umbonatus]
MPYHRSTPVYDPRSRQNAYSDYHRLIPSPIIQGHHPYFNKNPFEEGEDVEKYQHHKVILKAEEAQRNKPLSYQRIVCCPCLPCLPLWMRNMCCFLLLTMIMIMSIMVFFLLSFEAPQILALSDIQPQSDGFDLNFQYSVHNGNFFEINFHSVKAVSYFSSSNSTAMGVGEIHGLVLEPKSTRNITFPLHIVMDDSIQNKKGSRNDGMNEACTRSSGGETSIVYDIMPTFRIFNSPLFALAFKGQTLKIPCDKVSEYLKQCPYD